MVEKSLKQLALDLQRNDLAHRRAEYILLVQAAPEIDMTRTQTTMEYSIKIKAIEDSIANTIATDDPEFFKKIIRSKL